MPPTESQTEVAPLPNGPVAEAAERPRNQTDVYAVHGADPEVLAYAMAKYSRSALSMKESLREICCAARRAVSEHVLFPVWAPLDCRPGACCVRH